MSNTSRRIGILAALLLLALPLIGLGMHFYGQSTWTKTMKAFEADYGSLDYTKFDRPAPPEDKNAAEWLMGGAAAIVTSADEKALVNEMSRHRPAGWSAQQISDLRAVLTANQSAMDVMGKAVGLTESHFGIRYSEGWAMEFPDFISLLNAGKLLSVHAQLVASEGNPGQAIVSLEILERMIRALYEEPTIISRLVGCALERMSLQVVSEMLMTPQVSAETLAALPGLIQTGEVHTEMRSLLPFDVAVGASALRQGYRKSDLTDFGNLPDRSWLRGYLLGDLHAAEELETVRSAMTATAKPFGVAPDAFENCGRPILANAVSKMQAVMAQRELVLAALDIRRAGLEAGAYPTVTTLPADSFTGKPLLRSEDGDGVRLAVDGGQVLDDRIRQGGRGAVPKTWEIVLPALGEGS